ncbi:MAG: hypothetical protein ACYC8T_00685 [Myxococcaceae bacterium]
MSHRSALFAAACLAACTGTPPLAPGYPPPPSIAKGREPLVLTAEVAASGGMGALRVYGRDGALLRDLFGAADPGAGWTGVRVSAGGKLLYVQPPAVSSRMNLFVRGAVPGASEPAVTTQVLVREKHVTDDRVRLLGLTAEGARTFEATLDGSWDWFELSPTGRYLFGDNGQDRAVVYDTMQGRVAWTGSLRIAVFASDDSAVYLTTRDAEPTVVRQPLPSGAPTRHPLPAGTPGTGLVLLWPEAASPAGVVYRTAGNVSFGQFLWLLRPDGQWRAFDPKLERFSEESLVGFLDEGQAALFSRSASWGQTTSAPLGLFRLDLATGAAAKLDAPLGRFAAGSLYGVEGAAITRWTLDDPTPQTVATLRPLEGGWQRGLGEISDDGAVLVFDAMWVMGRMPDTFPEDGVVVQDSGGERLRFTPGFGELDRSGRLYAHRPEMEWPATRLAIGDVESGRATWLQTGAPFSIIYAAP